MKPQSLKPVKLRCGHNILVPSYQSSRLDDYGDTSCSKCSDTGPQKAKALPKPATPEDVAKSLEARQRGEV